MADLEEMGLLSAPHTSAGRLPTELGLRMFVDGLLEVGDLTSEERQDIEAKCAASGRPVEDALAEATKALSGLSRCAGLVMVPGQNAPLRHVEFVPISPDTALVVLLHEDGSVENRIIDLPPGLPSSSLARAGNYLSARVAGKTFEAVEAIVNTELAEHKTELDSLTEKVVEAGLAVWAGGKETGETLIIRGRGNLLEDVSAVEDLERIRQLFDDLERKKELIRLLALARGGRSMRIFIGSENNLFSLSGSSVIVSPYMNGAQQIVGVVGLIGPTRLNYARIIPMVDYTARMIGRIL